MEYFDIDNSRLCRVCASALDIPFKDESFDRVVGSGILHHFENPHDVLIEVKRVLKPGSIALFNHELISGLLGQHMVSSDEDIARTPNEWKSEIAQSGLSLIDMGPPEDYYSLIQERIGFCPEKKFMLKLLTLYSRLFIGGTGYCFVLRKD